MFPLSFSELLIHLSFLYFLFFTFWVLRKAFIARSMLPLPGMNKKTAIFWFLEFLILFGAIFQCATQNAIPIPVTPDRFPFHPVYKIFHEKPEKISKTLSCENLSQIPVQLQKLTLLKKEFPDFQQFMKELILTGEKEIPILYKKNFLKNIGSDESLKISKEAVDNLLSLLDLPLAKTPAIYPIHGIPKVLGFAFNGPAYYDFITHEILIPDREDFPASDLWFLSCILHEIIHASGISSEFQTTILEALSMILSSDKRLQFCGWYMILKRNPGFIPQKIWPEEKELLDFFMEEREHHRLVRNRLASQWSVSITKKVMKTGRIQNRPEKYGYLPVQIPKNPWFLSLEKIIRKLPEPVFISGEKN